MRTNFNFDSFVYYGVIVSKYLAHELALKNSVSTIYEFVENNDLNHQIIGDIRYSDMIIIGKEIHWDFGSHIVNVDIDNDNIQLKSFFNSSDEDHLASNPLKSSYADIDLKMKQLGFQDIPKLHIITNYGSM